VKKTGKTDNFINSSNCESVICHGNEFSLGDNTTSKVVTIDKLFIYFHLEKLGYDEPRDIKKINQDKLLADLKEAIMKNRDEILNGIYYDKYGHEGCFFVCKTEDLDNLKESESVASIFGILGMYRGELYIDMPAYELVLKLDKLHTPSSFDSWLKRMNNYFLPIKSKKWGRTLRIPELVEGVDEAVHKNCEFPPEINERCIKYLGRIEKIQKPLDSKKKELINKLKSEIGDKEVWQKMEI
jgi:hypothetical protein